MKFELKYEESGSRGKETSVFVNEESLTEVLSNLLFGHDNVAQVVILAKSEVTRKRPCDVCGHRWEGHTTGDGGQTITCEEDKCNCDGE